MSEPHAASQPQDSSAAQPTEELPPADVSASAESTQATQATQTDVPAPPPPVAPPPVAPQAAPAAPAPETPVAPATSAPAQAVPGAPPPAAVPSRAPIIYGQPIPTFANGKPAVDEFGQPVSSKSRLAAALLCWIVGFLGIHRFYVDKIGTGILMIFTLGGLGIWVLIDLVMILVGSFRDKDGLRLYNW